MKYLEPSYEMELIETADIMVVSGVTPGIGDNDTEELPGEWSMRNTSGTENVLGLR